MSSFPQVGLFDNHLPNLDSLSNDVHLIQQTLHGWTSIFSQLMEISIETHKQNQSNTALLQQLMAQKHRRSKHSQQKDQIKLSPIRPIKSEPDEILKLENFSKIFSNPKKISIMQLQGTPFDSAYESINKELEEPTRDDQYLSVPKSMQLSNDKNKKKKSKQIDLHPQSAKNTYENKQFAFNKPSQQDVKSNKENNQNQSSINRPESKRNLDYPQLSTVLEEKQSPLITPNDNNYKCSIAQSYRQYDQCSTSKASQNSQRPPNYFQQQQLQSENTRSSSKSCYGANCNLQQQVLTNNINIMNSPQNLQLMQQQPNQNQSQNNLISSSTKNVKQQHSLNNNVPIKQPIEVPNQIPSQRAKSYSEQNGKKQLSKRCLDIDLLDKQYETSQELIWKVQKNKK
ncbi:unnamed protein product (macronuclear) [Paramecium tetraurelia]|uniref:Uncharacterized protein n=1 Tax=Paramecium tetraurelia TaxID=5888 RepID=A0BU76_PARTE|nr:uncharacterized protein GSPATT00032325001 [Paramecium tetraurelia]CAK62093.1 unnamed protein product [Paramecium tetraurelia]|eukprot:XP_001429491.1 hypothetical protein (macronuclear) [Paramecium tetraurelia strain d4-2]